MDVRVSPELNAVLDAATALSVRRNHYWVGVEHIFETLATQNFLPKPIAQKYQQALTTTLTLVQQNVWQGVTPSTGQVFYTPRSTTAISSAPRIAEKLRSTGLHSGHLLLAILSDPDSSPVMCMKEAGLPQEELVADLRRALVGRGSPAPAAQAAAAATPQPGVAPLPQAQPEAAQAAAKVQEAEGQPEPGQDSGGLEELTTDLTDAARRKQIDPAIGRDTEMMQIIETLSRKTKNNVILTGEAGVGKTKIAEGLAVAIATGQFGDMLANKRILQLNVGTLMAGTQYRGALEERLNRLLEDAKRDEDCVVFIDEIHLIMGAGSVDEGSIDVANLLKPALARGELRCIGATTISEYRKFIEKDPAIERRFQLVRVEPLSDAATFDLLKKLRQQLSKHHGVYIGSHILHSIITMTNRYMVNRHQPDKAIDVLDQACARFRLKIVAARQGLDHSRTGLPSEGQRPELTLHEVRKVIGQLTGISIEELTATERLQLENLDRVLAKRIIGQDEAVRKVTSVVKKSRAGLADPNRPDAVLLFVGPTGVGKTQLAKELARVLFGSTNHLITFDMSEYIEEHSVSKLLGAPPGYVGSEEEGQLIAAVKSSPFSIMLFDEMEKAHPRIMDAFLPVFDEGRLKDPRGRIVSFRNTIIVLTSNMGAELLMDGSFEERSEELLEQLRQYLRPELVNRIDEVVPFYPLVFEDVRSILRLELQALNARLVEQGMSLRVYQQAYRHLAEQGYSREYGAREIRRTVERLVTEPISERVVSGAFSKGDTVEVLMEEGSLVYRKAQPKS
jgi:ATP-dependent Clp protease ATP-binding subunit ClpC